MEKRRSGPKRSARQQTIGADESDLKNNRLGLMSAAQIEMLAGRIDDLQSQTGRMIKRCVQLAALVTVAVVILTFVRVLLLPIALVIEIIAVGVMLAMTSNLNRFAQLLQLDLESQAVRIIKGRTSRFTMRPHPMYHTLRVELQTYRLLDQSLHRQFVTGELYQLYVLPHSGVVIAAELVGEKEFLYLH